MSGPYDDIINLPRPTSSGHPRMPICDRAFIFSPFAALAGHGAAIVGTVRRTEQRMELDEDATAELDRRQAVLLEHLNEQPEITVTWFRPDERKEGGASPNGHRPAEKVRRNWNGFWFWRTGRKIPLEDVAALESDIFQMLMI